MGLFGLGRQQGYGDGYGSGGGRGGLGGLPMRLIIAVVVAGIGFFTYFRSTQVNPVTGEKQHVAMSVDQEKALGLQAAPKMAEQMGGALDPKTDPDARMVAEVGHRLVKQSEAANSPYTGNFNFYLLNDPQTINAFALPGGQIFITRGLYSKLQDESQLAGVLGHEIGHVIHRHSAQQMAKGQLGQMLVVATGIGASDDRGHGQMAAAAAAMANQMAQQMGGVLDPRQDPDARVVAEVGHKLVNSTEASKSPYVGNFNFYLLDDPKTINAFALPGGQIFITRALFSRLEDESQLAGVLGHEVGHVIHRHSAQQMAKGQLGQMLVVATGVGASDDRGHGQMATAAAAMANQMMQLKYGRGDETQSDSYGLKLMAQAGYDPRGMLAVMQVLKAAGGGGRQPEFLSSHPLPDNRLEEIKQIIAQTYPKGVPQTLTRGRELGGSDRLVGDRQRSIER